MDWDKLRIFHAVASAGSFTHAGQMLTLSQSAVSRQISALEEEIVTPLFQRHARGLTLTDEGELLYGAVSDVLTRLGQAEEALKNAQSAPRGSLKITSSHGLGTYWLLPRLNEFLPDYPELQVHLVFEDHELDLAQREADLALRMRAPVQADLIQRKLFTVRYHIYASPEYLARAGTPQVFEDLVEPYGYRLWRNGDAGNPRRELAAGCDAQARTRRRRRALRINNLTRNPSCRRSRRRHGSVARLCGARPARSRAHSAGGGRPHLRRASRLLRRASPIQTGRPHSAISSCGRRRTGNTKVWPARFRDCRVLKSGSEFPISVWSRTSPHGSRHWRRTSSPPRVRPLGREAALPQGHPKHESRSAPSLRLFCSFVRRRLCASRRPARPACRSAPPDGRTSSRTYQPLASANASR